PFRRSVEETLRAFDQAEAAEVEERSNLIEPEARTGGLGRSMRDQAGGEIVDWVCTRAADRDSPGGARRRQISTPEGPNQTGPDERRLPAAGRADDNDHPPLPELGEQLIALLFTAEEQRRFIGLERPQSREGIADRRRWQDESHTPAAGSLARNVRSRSSDASSDSNCLISRSTSRVSKLLLMIDVGSATYPAVTVKGRSFRHPRALRSSISRCSNHPWRDSPQ